MLVSDGLLLAGLALLLVGFCFKVAAVPFHMWTPDVYQGSPSPVTGFMAAVAKIGGFAALLRVFVSTFGSLRADWQPVVYAIAIVTLLLGAGLAVVQRDIKRMLAYSSINHAGFVLLGLEAATTKGVSAALYYLFAYTFMVIGTFAIVTVLGREGDGHHDIASYRGLAKRQPLLALSLAILLLAQAGCAVHDRALGEAPGRHRRSRRQLGAAGRRGHGLRRGGRVLLPPGGRPHVLPTPRARLGAGRGARRGSARAAGRRRGRSGRPAG